MTDAAGAASRAPDVSALTRVVALDGPAGSGKSTVARLAAQALGWRFVDTGATYRAVTLQVLRSGVALDDEVAVTRAAESAQVELDVDPFSTRVELGGEDVSAEIRGPAVTAAVSAVSSVPGVRRHLVQLQRQLMGTEGAVVEGRDIATVVAPCAAVKVYLDAREEVRARRRAADHAGALLAAAPVPGSSSSAAAGAARARPGVDTEQAPDGLPTGGADVTSIDVEAVQAELRRRDTLDSKTNKLEASEGAVHLDTSDLALDQVVEAVVSLVRAAGFDVRGGTG